MSKKKEEVQEGRTNQTVFPTWGRQPQKGKKDTQKHYKQEARPKSKKRQGKKVKKSTIDCSRFLLRRAAMKEEGI